MRGWGRWLVERWLERWSFEEVEALVRADPRACGETSDAKCNTIAP